MEAAAGERPEVQGRMSWYLQPLRLLQAQSQGAVPDRKRADRVKLLERQGYDAIGGVGGVIFLADGDRDVSYYARAFQTKPLARVP